MTPIARFRIYKRDKRVDPDTGLAISEDIFTVEITRGDAKLEFHGGAYWLNKLGATCDFLEDGSAISEEWTTYRTT